MKVQIIRDMEGVGGIVKWEQMMGGDPMDEEGARSSATRAGLGRPRTLRAAAALEPGASTPL